MSSEEAEILVTTGTVTFGPAETITVGELRRGDFIVVMPTQRGVRGYRWNSAVAEITDPAFGRWRTGPPGKRKTPLKSRKFRLMSVDGIWDVPVDHTVTVRRPVS